MKASALDEASCTHSPHARMKTTKCALRGIEQSTQERDIVPTCKMRSYMHVYTHTLPVKYYRYRRVETISLSNLCNMFLPNKFSCFSTHAQCAHAEQHNAHCVIVPTNPPSMPLATSSSPKFSGQLLFGSVGRRPIICEGTCP